MIGSSDLRRIKLSLLLPLMLSVTLSACVTSVYNPTKTAQETKADVDLCVTQATANRPMGLSFDPLGEVEDAYKCLEAKGYSRNQAVAAAPAPPPRPEGQALVAGNKPPADKATEKQPVLPCVVPCIRKR